MKKLFKKALTIASSALLVGSSIGMAAAAAYPAPFVEGGVANVAVVIGADAALSDAVAASAIGNDLATALAAQTAESGSTIGSTASGGDSVKLEKSTNLFNLGDEADEFYSTLDNEELSTVLADGVYTNDENDEFDYEQEISLGDQINLTHFHKGDLLDDVPVIGFNLASGTHIMNYTLDFTDDAEAGGDWVSGNDLETTDIEMLGRSYYILSARNTTATNHKITLLDSANSAIVTEGESSTIVVDDTSYEISLEFIDGDDVILNVNGVSTNKLAEGGVYKVADDTYIAVKSNLYNTKDNGISKVEVSIGSGKIVLENGAEVKINGEDVSNIEYSMLGTDEVVSGVVKSYITRSGNNLQKIVLEWNLDDDAWISEGAELLFPGFETIKLSYNGFNVPTEEITKIEANGDTSIKLSTEITDGAITLDFLSLNSSQTGFDSLGKDDDEVLVTNASIDIITIDLNESENTQFPVTWVNGDDFESYLFEISKIEDASGKNKTTLKNLADSTKDVVLSEVGDIKDRGQVRFTLTSASDNGKNAVVTLTRSGGTGTLYADRLITKEGLLFRLPVINTTNCTTTITAPQINLNSSCQQNTWVMNFTEEDKDGQIAAGENFSVDMGVDEDDGGEPTDISLTNKYETEDGSKVYEAYVVSDLATKVLISKPSSGLNDVEIIYHGDEAFGDVFVSEAGVTFAAGTSTSGTATELGNPTIYDNEVSSASGKNLIVVGGSCINSVASELLDGAGCGDSFTAAAGVSAGEALIKSFDRNGKVALLVAGYNAADTTKAATYLTNNAVDTTVGSALKVTSATEATAITSSE